ncbi:MAG: DUF2178 domain-containing protein [Dehalococcoidales bacterium]|nr:DUF2178 domain-containing protein [Dehalococcoidales bacterium]
MDILNLLSFILSEMVVFFALRELGFWTTTVQIVITIIVVIASVVTLISVIVRKKPLARITADERTDAIFNKSSRNALFILSLGLFVRVSMAGSNGVDGLWLIYIIGASLLVNIGSQLFYYYRKV